MITLGEIVFPSYLELTSIEVYLKYYCFIETETVLSAQSKNTTKRGKLLFDFVRENRISHYLFTDFIA